MKKTWTILFVILLLAGSSPLFAQPAKVLLLEPETEKVPYSTAFDAQGWMKKVFDGYKYYLELADIGKARDILSQKGIYLSKCRTPEEFFNVGDILNVDQIVYSKLTATELQYVISIAVYDMQSKALLFKKETSCNITSKNDLYCLVTQAAEEFTNTIYNFYINRLEDVKDTVVIDPRPGPGFRKLSDIVGEKEYNKYIKIQFKKPPVILTDTNNIIYPSELKDKGIEGTIYLHVLVDKDGKVSRVETARSSGISSLDSAAVNMAKQFHYEPAIDVDDKVRSFWNVFPVIFDLNNNKIRFSEIENAPEIVNKASPVYPQAAKEKGIQGKVILYLLVGRNGKVRQVEIAKTSGSSLLDESATIAAKQFIFRPAVAPGGKFVQVWVMYPVTFALE